VKKYKDHTLQEFLEALSKKTPVPGGGSAAALVAATGIALIVMAAHYSKNKSRSRSIANRIQSIITQGTVLRRRLVALVDLDAQAYLKVVKTRHDSTQAQKAALQKAADVPREVCRLCYQGITLIPFLVEQGNVHLISDIEVAVEMLLAAFKAAMITVEVNA
jgi:formiminotetrahydrofolate cyclodeaminase